MDRNSPRSYKKSGHQRRPPQANYNWQSGTFTKFANLLTELLGGLDDLLPDVGFPCDAQVVFVPGLDHQRRYNCKDYQDQEPAGETNAHPGPVDEPGRSFRL